MPPAPFRSAFATAARRARRITLAAARSSHVDAVKKTPKRSGSVRPAPSANATHPFGCMGVSPLEDEIYRALLRHDGLSLADLSKRLGRQTRTLAQPLRTLIQKGMATHSLDRTPRYFAIPPDIAVEALIASSQRNEEARQRKARAAAARLNASSEARGHRNVADERLVEILSAEATAQMFVLMHRTAQSEMLSLTRQPMLISNINEPDHLLFECLARGVRCRALVDSDLLAMPGWLEHMRDNTSRGEECRIAPSLPFKLIVADRRIAIIPLDLARPDGPVLLVRSSSLLEALCAVFELLWRNATPFPLDDSDQAASGRQASASLLSLLTSGLNDKAIELDLDMSHRTLARRISELMKDFGATTRCQLGWLAAQRAARTGGG
jgi:sugar-specific transcriptional regulator TrmB